jgi:hypothetical protein
LRPFGDSLWISVPDTIYDTLYTFTGLLPAAQYEFSVSSFCTGIIKSRYQNTTASTTICEIPSSTTAEVVNNTALITWQMNCESAFNQVRYMPVDSIVWTYVFTGNAPAVLLGDLSWDGEYIYQVAACEDTLGSWTPIDTFTIDKRPNILLIVLDDARFNSYTVNGGPEFFQSVSLDRIANEGVNFKKAFATYSLCAPSRATMFTGLYPHKNGAYNNQTIYNTSLPTIGTILHDDGYYTAMLGKFLMPGLPNEPQPGWDFWMAQDKWAKIDPEYNYNGTLVQLTGHELDIITDTAIHLFATKPADQPMLLMLCYLTPHVEYIPRPQDAGIFAGDTMPFPENFYPYPDNYPSFYYTAIDSAYRDSATLAADIQNYFESLYGLDQDVGRLLDTLETLEMLDNTVVILISDNGYFHGEHLFEGKKIITRTCYSYSTLCSLPEMVSAKHNHRRSVCHQPRYCPNHT